VDEAARGARTLVISTDPAPSLGDALGLRLTGSPRPVPLPRGSLHALEVSSHEALARWLRPRRRILETIALRGTWLDEADVRELLRQSLPGIDQITALLEILRHARSRKYDVIVVHTAPAGHTLRMLAMPGTLSAVARVFHNMQAKHRAMVEALRGVAIEDEADELIRRLQQDAQTLTNLLRNADDTEVSLVTLPETLAVEETLDVAESLLEMDIPIAQAIVNRVTQPPPQKCSWCDARRRIERDAISVLAARCRSLASEFERPTPRFALVSEHRTEPIGPRALRQVAAELRKPASPRDGDARRSGGARHTWRRCRRAVAWRRGSRQSDS
jgi:arsenite-transporting ATPase